MTQTDAPVAPDTSLETRAAALVNPASGLANDYLNLFNEVVMLMEQLPDMPELIDDLLAWRPTTYEEYFTRSILPGRHSALEAYSELNQGFRLQFEVVVADLDRLATGSVALIRRHLRKKGTSDLEELAATCTRAGAAMRAVLDRAAMIVNHGAAEENESAQRRADRLMAVRSYAIRDMAGSFD